MTPTNSRPAWACADWGAEHDWMNCPECLAAHEELIEDCLETADAEAVESNSP
jgi:hypothetical protein